jgi:hypothetical protein
MLCNILLDHNNKHPIDNKSTAMMMELLTRHSKEL